MKFKVIVELSHPTAQNPGVPTMVYVTETCDMNALRAAAKLGGCDIRVFTVDLKNIEDVLNEVRAFSSTRVGS